MYIYSEPLLFRYYYSLKNMEHTDREVLNLNIDKISDGVNFLYITNTCISIHNLFNIYYRFYVKSHLQVSCLIVTHIISSIHYDWKSDITTPRKIQNEKSIIKWQNKNLKHIKRIGKKMSYSWPGNFLQK